MIIAFLTAITAQSPLMFKGYVPPHRGNDGISYRIIAHDPDRLAPLLRGCGIEDYALLSDGYQFAVTRSTEDKAGCVRGRAPAGARIEKLDHWIVDAKTD